MLLNYRLWLCMLPALAEMPNQHLESLSNSLSMKWDATRKDRFGYPGVWRLSKEPFAKDFLLVDSQKLKKPIAKKVKCLHSQKAYEASDRRKLISIIAPANLSRDAVYPDNSKKSFNCKTKQCGRYVFDGKFTEHELLEAERLGIEDGQEAQKTGTVLPFHKSPLFHWSGIDTIKELIEEKFGASSTSLNPQTYAYNINEVTSSGTLCQLHSDMLSTYKQNHYYSALMYLVNQKEGECGRCETVIVDGVNSTGHLESGLSVQPRRGRLLLFTSGPENLHCRMETFSGERRLMQFWFNCGAREEL